MPKTRVSIIKFSMNSPIAIWLPFSAAKKDKLKVFTRPMNESVSLRSRVLTSNHDLQNALHDTKAMAYAVEDLQSQILQLKQPKTSMTTPRSVIVNKLLNPPLSTAQDSHPSMPIPLQMAKELKGTLDRPMNADEALYIYTTFEKWLGSEALQLVILVTCCVCQKVRFKQAAGFSKPRPLNEFIERDLRLGCQNPVLQYLENEKAEFSVIRIYDTILQLMQTLYFIEPRLTSEARHVAARLHFKMMRNGLMHSPFDPRYRRPTRRAGSLLKEDFSHVELYNIDDGRKTLQVPIFTQLLRVEKTPIACIICAESIYNVSYDAVDEWIEVCSEFDGDWLVENQHSPQTSPAQTADSLSSSVPQPNLDSWAVPQNVGVRPQGVESTLSWKIFSADRPNSCLFAQNTLPDLDELHHMMIHVAEHGFDWSTGACLVALVCANAAITDSHTEISTSPEVTPEKKAEIELSMQFWSVAVKRLGYASAQNTVRAVQCLCLAVIWERSWYYYFSEIAARHVINRLAQMNSEAPEVQEASFNVPSVRVSDGPNGVRGTKFVDGVPAACLPCGTGLAATWDQDLLYKAGTLIGDECIAKGAHCWLGPTVCIQRSPLGGRGFESMAEDPYATGKLAAAYINGVQSTGVVSVIKHWLANDQEHERVGVNVVASERALREIHMLPFQIALSDAAPGAVMACYNKVNGKHVSENRDFLDSLLREEWQWKGLIMSDWFGTYSTTEAINAGLDLEMPGPTRQRGQLLDLAVSTRKVSRSTIDTRARNVLEFVQRCTKVPVAEEEGGRDFPEDRQLNRKLAGDSVVLLKNEAHQLPLKRCFKSIALIGPNMKTTSFCGGGSAHLQPYYTVSPYEGIVAQLPPDVEVRYEVGASANGWNPLLQGDMITTPEGAPGMRMRFYSQGPSVSDREIIDESHLPDSSWLLMGYSHPKLDKLFYATVEGDVVAQESGPFEFGLAVYGSARLYIDGQLLIDNSIVQRSGTFFFGKGTVEEKAEMRLVQGQKYRITIEYASAPSSRLVKPGVVNFGGGAGRVGLASAIDPEIGIQKAVSAALQSDVTILCVGMTRDQESEGFDRPHMDLPGSLPRLASAVLAAVPDAIVVTQSGTPFNMLWSEQAKTHVHAWLAGNETGNGIADVLFGETCPSGKLPLSFPRRIQDTPTFLNFGSERGRVIYGEDIYVGYRYYEKVDREVLYPFGHGLSYTTFTYDKLHVTSSHVSFEITNSGSVAGAEVSQLYIAADETTSSIQRPKKELKGFNKTYLQPAEVKRVEIPLDRFTTSFWDEELHCWVSESGVYRILVGSSSSKILLTGELHVEATTRWTGL
ncbi:hypothetical protein FVER53590_30396 [Fusarium verticillioides]|nr:hypothetical protein FVER53590_30396 [Fusarium verticillioides]